MSIFKSKETKEFEKKITLKKTINEMNKQLNMLQQSKNTYIEKAKEAKIHGLTNELNLAISALKSAMTQEKKIREMKINFEIMMSLKDMLKTTSEFLGGMKTLSKDMVKLTDDRQFNKVAKQFGLAMMATEKQKERVELFLDDSKDSFSSLSETSDISNEEIMSLIDEEIIQGDKSDNIDNILDNLDKKIKDKQ